MSDARRNPSHTPNTLNPQLSPNFDLARLTYSDTARERGIANDPLPQHLPHLRLLAAALEEVQALLGAPLTINSGYRSPALNAAVGGVPRSLHAQGLAVDFVCPGFGAPLEIARAIAASAIVYDQIIHEFGRWVHLGLATPGLAPRRQLLTICSSAQGYLDGLHACGQPA
ncbi:MAG TPA: D-Ala-D-Ala carboxypeptidase family metallohydrolase [Burkholderiales bacterium]